MSRNARLVSHPATPAPRIEAFQVALKVHPGGALELAYEVKGEIPYLTLPRGRNTTRAEGLWRHTCLELFVAADGTTGYREFNFSPAGQWQAYAFRAYREGGLLEPAKAPEIATEFHPGRLIARVRLPIDNLPPGERLRLGLCAVLEAEDGALSYWALRHAPGKPDFHHPDTFALEIDLRNPQP